MVAIELYHLVVGYGPFNGYAVCPNKQGGAIWRVGQGRYGCLSLVKGVGQLVVFGAPYTHGLVSPARGKMLAVWCYGQCRNGPLMAGKGIEPLAIGGPHTYFALAMAGNELATVG